MDDQIIKDITAEIDNAFTPEGAAELRYFAPERRAEVQALTEAARST